MEKNQINFEKGLDQLNDHGYDNIGNENERSEPSKIKESNKTNISTNEENNIKHLIVIKKGECISFKDKNSNNSELNNDDIENSQSPENNSFNCFSFKNENPDDKLKKINDKSNQNNLYNENYNSDPVMRSRSYEKFNFEDEREITKMKKKKKN